MSSLLCTCGKNYAEIMNVEQRQRLEENTEHQQALGNSQIAATPPIHSHTTLQSTIPSLDASFVQIPFHQPTSPSRRGNNTVLRKHNTSVVVDTDSKMMQGNNNASTSLSSSQAVSQQQKNYFCSYYSNDNFRYIQGITQLYNIAAISLSSTASNVNLPEKQAPTPPVSICHRCVERLEKAIADDTERLLSESICYEEAIRNDETIQSGYNKQIKMYRTSMMNGADDENDGGVVSATNEFSDMNHPIHVDTEKYIEDQYIREIQLLEAACQEHQEELLRLRSIMMEQAQIYDELEQYAESLATTQNALELEARAFDNDQEQLTRMLLDVQGEIERLMSSEIKLPTILIQLHVDVERGLRYPLINELRLAYRPKGDVQWDEIQTAWALAAYLLFVVATIYGFQSHNWKIVPLSHCAKLIYSPPQRQTTVTTGGASTSTSTTTKEGANRLIVFNLGHPQTNGNKALLTWNALMCEVILHVTNRNNVAIQHGVLDASTIPELPYDISPTSIGGIILTKLNVNDDSGWSKVIHYMASNLQWLSNCASIYILQQVVLFAPLAIGIVTESPTKN